jgi:hypothetical protein
MHTHTWPEVEAKLEDLRSFRGIVTGLFGIIVLVVSVLKKKNGGKISKVNALVYLLYKTALYRGRLKIEAS